VTPRPLRIAIDGPSGAGKSTAGRELARRLGYVYVDTGAMYRALGLAATRRGLSLEAEAPLAGLCRASRIDLTPDGRVLLDGEDVSLAIRAPEISIAASKVSAHPEVRREMVARQRQMGCEGGVVMDGRDIGTAVFPDADLKFYIDADPLERARRRQAEQAARGVVQDIREVEQAVRERDWNDSHRAASPLVRATDAVRVDTTALSPEGVVQALLDEVSKRADSQA
jgi:cytidylate kinase